MEHLKSIVNRLNMKVDMLESRNNRLQEEMKMIREKHRQEIHDWQIACSVLEDEILEIQEKEGV